MPYNILFIISDQLRHDALGYITPAVITPNINRLAEQSVTCARAFVQSPQCQPSRASFLTGRYPSTIKMWWNESKLNESEITIGNILRDFGYSTAYFGKSHLTGGDPTTLANHFGFDTTFLTEDWYQLLQHSPLRRNLSSLMQNSNWSGKLVPSNVYHDDVITSEASCFINNCKDPYFAVVSFNSPHPPYTCPEQYYDMYKDSDLVNINPKNSGLSHVQWAELKSYYYGSISWMDHNIGKLLQNVDYTNTIIIFMSDHGDMLGDHGLISKGLYAYDGVVQIPLLMRFPGISSYRYEYLVQAIDIVPTILQYINYDNPRFQGSHLLNHLIMNTECNDYVLSMIGHGIRLRMIRTLSDKYWIYGNEEHLYDIINDPMETTNLIYRRELVEEMRFKLLRAMIEAEDPLPIPQ